MELSSLQQKYGAGVLPLRWSQVVLAVAIAVSIGLGCKRKTENPAANNGDHPKAQIAAAAGPAKMAEIQELPRDPSGSPVASPDSPAKESGSIGDLVSVRTYALKMSLHDLESVEHQGYDNRTVPAVFIADGKEYPDAALRIRGAWARTWPKKALKIVLSKQDRFEGHHAVNLNSGWRDPAFVREPLAYYFYRRCGVPAPESHLVRLLVNGRFHGLYVEVEQAEKPLLKRSNLKGAVLYKARSGQADERDLGPVARFQNVYERASDKGAGLEDLQRFCHNLKQSADPQDFFSREVDLDRYINYLAASAIIQQWDGISKNHYLVHDAEGSGKWFTIPWDLDRTFGDWWDGSFNHFDSPIFLGIQQLPGITGWNRLEDKFFQVPALRARFLKRVAELLDQEFTPEKLNPVLDQLEAAIAKDAAKDRELWPCAAGNLHSGIQGVKRYIERRRSYLKQELAKMP